MMATNHTIFEEDRVFGFQFNAHHLKQVIAECMISMFIHWQLLSKHAHICVPRLALPVGCGFNNTPS